MSSTAGIFGETEYGGGLEFNYKWLSALVAIQIILVILILWISWEAVIEKKVKDMIKNPSESYFGRDVPVSGYRYS